MFKDLVIEKLTEEIFDLEEENRELKFEVEDLKEYKKLYLELEEKENDYYILDTQSIKLFLYEFWKENTFEGDILDLSCEQSNISSTLKELLPNFDITSSNLIDRECTRTFDTVIATSSLDSEYLEKALEMSDNYVIVLSNIELLVNSKIKDIFLNTPLKYIYIHASTQATWFVWEKRYIGEPVIRWF